MMNFPLYVLDLLFALWIAMAIRRTLSYLHKKNQAFKLKIMKTYALVLAIGVICVLLTGIVRSLDFLMSSRPSHWRFTAIEFFVVSTILSVSAYVFRPQIGSKNLAEVEEVLDETLTEIDGPSARTHERPSLGGPGRPDTEFAEPHIELQEKSASKNTNELMVDVGFGAADDEVKENADTDEEAPSPLFEEGIQDVEILED